MSYKLNWFDKEFYEYYVSGAITHNFDVQKQNTILKQLVADEKEIMTVFKEKDNMMILEGFIEYQEEENDEDVDFIGYLLDDSLVELIKQQGDEVELSLMIGIIALQYFQFDTLEDIIYLDEADLEELDPEDREEIEEIRSVFQNMPEEEREKFLEQELFYYEETELKSWMEKHQ